MNYLSLFIVSWLAIIEDSTDESCIVTVELQFEVGYLVKQLS